MELSILRFGYQTITKHVSDDIIIWPFPTSAFCFIFLFQLAEMMRVSYLVHAKDGISICLYLCNTYLTFVVFDKFHEITIILLKLLIDYNYIIHKYLYSLYSYICAVLYDTLANPIQHTSSISEEEFVKF